MQTRYAVIPLLCCLFGAAPLALSAQDDGTSGPPKVLVIEREFTKPGKSGTLHEKSESLFINALAAAKAKPRYLALVSLSGQSRALFLSGYSSFAAWEEENKGVEKNATLSAALDRATASDGDLLSEVTQSVWTRRDDLSLNSGNLVGARYMDITQFIVRPGHAHEWNELVKMVIAGYKKGVPDANWTTFEQQYGMDGSSYLVISPLKSLTEIDQHMTSDKGFVDAMGAEGMKKFEALEASCVESERSNLFQISPKMSYPPESWIATEPDFWKPKPTPVKKTTPKPAQ
jgi:hypothetical protein